MSNHPKLVLRLIALLGVMSLILSISAAQDGGALPLPPPPAANGSPTPEPAADNLMTVTPENTVEPTVSTTTSFPLTTRLLDDFQNGLGQWSVTDGVITAADVAGNSYAVLGADDTVSSLYAPTLTGHSVTVWFALTGESAALTIAYGDRLTVSAVGGTFSSGEAVSAQADIPVSLAIWHKLQIIGQSGVTTVTLDDVPYLSAPSAVYDGTFALGALGGEVWIDDVTVESSESIATPEATLAPPPEITAEPTLEPTAEITPELTPEITPEVPAVLTFDAAKLDPVLVNLLNAQISGADVNAEIQNYSVPVDGRGRIRVLIWAAAGVPASALEAGIRAQGGAIGAIDFTSLDARLSLEGIAALSLDPNISVILVQPRAVSGGELAAQEAQQLTRAAVRAPAGTSFSAGFDLVGAQAWHLDGFRGAGVRIALLDAGFGTATTVNSDISCYRASSVAFTYPAGGVPQASDPARGRRMLEILCDVAPDSDVKLYRVNSQTDLYNAINVATVNSDVIVIGVDMGVHTSPGNGTLGYVSTKDPYAAIAAARAAGVVVVAAAGNNGIAQKSFTYNGGAATVPITVLPGDVVNVSWSAWSTTTDLSINLSGSGINLSKPPRGTATPGHQFVIPANCTVNGSGFCTPTLSVTGFASGIGPVVVQVQAAGVNLANRSVGTLTGGTLIADAGSLARPADSPNVIAVGAVCADAPSNYPALDYSSRGPIFSIDGTFAMPSAPFSRASVKPDVVSAAQVDTSTSSVSAASPCTTGFGGTQSAVSHVGGMVALFLSHTQMSSVQNASASFALVKDYLQHHSFEMPFGVNADGYDMDFGAGFAVLGSPQYDYQTFRSSEPASQAPSRLPAGVCTGGVVYAGNLNLNDPIQDGTLEHPYHHPAYAVVQAQIGVNKCVVVLPGEYATPLLLTGFTNPVRIFGYSSVASGLARPTTLYTQNLYTGPQVGNDPFRAAGIYTVSQNNTLVSGFTFTQGAVFGGTVLRDAQAFVSDTSLNVQFSNNFITGFDSIYPLVEIIKGSHGARIEGNTFMANMNKMDGTAVTGQMLLLNVDESGTVANPTIITNNQFDGNQGTVGSYTVNGVTGGFGIGLNNFAPLVKLVNSTVDLTNNQFTDNISETVLAAVTSLRGDSPHELRALGNVFVNNLLRSDQGELSGPLVNLFNMQKFYFVNNTVGGNDLSDSGGNGYIIGRGNSIAGDFSEAGSFSGSMSDIDARWDLHNNFIYNNKVPGGVVSDLDTSAQCKSNNPPSADGTGATNNWVFRTNVAALPIPNLLGVCANSFENAARENILTLDPFPFDDVNGVPVAGASRYIIGSSNGIPATEPAYYALTGYIAGTPAGSDTLDGVDEGLHDWLQTRFASFYSGDDVRGVPRVLNSVIDFGAYEKTPFTLTVGAFSEGLLEDSGPHTLNLAPYIEGGFPPYTLTINTPLQYFGVSADENCDLRFSASSKGIVFEQLDLSNINIIYCPPDNFHTQSLAPTFNSLGMSMQFTVRDASGTAASASLAYEITQVNDSNLTTPLSYEQSVGLGRNNTLKLRPFVDMTNNFVFSERGTAMGSQVDYDFSYSNLQFVSGDSQLDARKNTSQFASGLLSFNLSDLPVTTEYSAVFSYTATDRRGNPTVNTLTVRAVAPPQPFVLQTPANNAVAGTVTAFTWQTSSNATSYDFNLTYTGLITDETIDETGLTPTAGDDSLTCTASVCTYALNAAEQALLIDGSYFWTVSAFNDGLEEVASNAPFTLNMRDELLLNGGFEIAGSPASRPANWLFAGTSGVSPRRDCSVGVAQSGSCAIRFTATAGVNYNVRQRFTTLPAYRNGDKFVATGFYNNVNSNKGKIILRITLANGTVVNVPRRITGTNTGWVPFRLEYTVTGAISAVELRLETKGGTGVYYADSLSLALERNRTFNLMTPSAGANFAVNGGGTIPNNLLTTFLWRPSSDAPIYKFTLEDITDDALIFDEVEFTAARDGDPLNCFNTLCRLKLPSQTLEAGLYRWSVMATGGFTPTNGPREFRVVAETERVNNGAMEGTNLATAPTGWNFTTPINGFVRCENPNAKPIKTYQGTCSYRFNAGQLGRIVQVSTNVADMVPGATVNLRAAFNGVNTIGSAGIIQMELFYVGGGKKTVNLRPANGSYGFTEFSTGFVLPKAVSRFRIRIGYSGATGALGVDNVSVTVTPP